MRNGLLLGLDGAGKTLLLRRLAHHVARNHKSVVERIVAMAQGVSCVAGGGAVTATAAGGGGGGIFNESEDDFTLQEIQPTIGVEHTALKIENRTFSICEIGGQLLPMWKSYFDGCDFWIFVFDLSDPAQFAGAVIEFFNIMRVENMRKKPKLLLLNKMDACFTIEDALVRSYLMLDRLMTDAFSASTPSGPMHVVKMSAFTGENIDSVLRWIQQRWNQSGTANTANGGPSTAHVSHQSKTERQRVHPVGQ